MFAVIVESLIKPIVLVGLLLMMALCGCASVGEKSQIKEEFKEAVGATDADWVERRKDVLLRARVKLDDISKDTVKIEKSGQKMAGARDLKRKFQNKVGRTQESLANAKTSFQILETTEAADWEQRHTDFKNKMNVLEAQFHELRSMVK